MQIRICGFIVAFGLVAGLAACATTKEEKGEQKVSVTDLPPAVHATVDRLTAGGAVEKIDKENENGKVVYDVEAKVAGKAMEFDIAADGTVLTSEESVEYGSLPAAVRAAAEQYFGSATGLDASKELEDGKTYFEVEGKKDGKKAAVKMDESGKVLEKEEAGRPGALRVLLIEDSKTLQRSLSTALRKVDYAVDATGDGAEGLWYAESNAYDVIILDLMLPGMDGLSILRRLRRLGQSTQVLILTARDTVEDRVRGLQTGADDYLIKPFALEELLARVQALCRRQYQRKDPHLRVGDLEIDTAARTVTCRGKVVDLTPREYRLLEYLASRAGEVVSRTDIWAHVYDEHTEPMSNAVDSAICILRKKIEPPELLRTRRGMGYVLEP